MSKYAQTFKNIETVYKYDSKTDSVIDSGEEIVLQERMNSFFDELFYVKLEKYFDGVPNVKPEILDGVENYVETASTNADRCLDALQTVENLRVTHSIPETYTITEALEYLRQIASKGGRYHETLQKKNAQQESEQKELSQNDDENA